jgi:hypothetical protein
MMLPMWDGLVATSHFDAEMAQLADRHYSRRTVGARQFMYSGRKLVLRDPAGLVLFAENGPAVMPDTEPFPERSGANQTPLISHVGRPHCVVHRHN